MKDRNRTSLLVILLLSGSLALHLSSATAKPTGGPGQAGNGQADAGQDRQPATFQQIEAVVRQHFAKKPDYQPGDLLAASDVLPLYDQFKKLGFNSRGFEQLQVAISGDDAFLVRQFSSKRGRAFMRQVSGYPDAYDRLDRLSRIPDGQRTVIDLIGSKGGYRMIKYMTTSRGGRNLGKQLSHTPGGSHFNQATGKVYTEKQLVAALRTLYDQASKTR